MKMIFAGSVLALGLLSAAPTVAQQIDLGPGGPSIDLRNRRDRQRDFDREEARRDDNRDRRREMRRRDYEDDDAPVRPRRY